VARIHRVKTERYGEILAQREIALRPGIAGLIADAAVRGLRLAIATTTNRPNVDALVEATMGRPAGEVFEVIAAGDEVKAKKPAPDVYVAALERLGLPASACLALEDSRNGLRSAGAAGIATIVSPSRYTTGEDFTGAVAVVDDFAALSGIDEIAALLSRP
jgi:HAD superfamily hydrolase (TIGR01509 family)